MSWCVCERGEKGRGDMDNGIGNNIPCPTSRRIRSAHGSG